MTDRTCTVDGCTKKPIARGWCSGHYQRWRIHGDPTAPRQPREAKRPCMVDECSGLAHARGLCDRHYQQAKRAGHLPERLPGRPAECVVPGCTNSVNGFGLCSKHYTRWRIHGGPDGLGDQPPDGERPPYGTKWCRRCRAYRPLDEFYVSKKGPESPCKSCRSIYARAYRKRNPPRSRSSQNRKRRARMAAARTERYTAAEIAERDGWRCQICGKRIGRSYKFPHPRSLSIDHIIPIRHGGDDVKTNVQAAHFRCNAAKGSRGVDQLRLIG